MQTTLNAGEQNFQDPEAGHFQQNDDNLEPQTGNPEDETQDPPIVNKQGEDVVNPQDEGETTEGEADGTGESSMQQPQMDEPAGDGKPPEVDIDPETPATDAPTM